MPRDVRPVRARSVPVPDAPGQLRVALLGGFEVAVGHQPVPAGAWRLRRARDVVKLLALAPGYHLHREQVMESLWPERTPEAAANNLHQALHVGRKALERAGGRGEMLQLAEGVLQLCPDGAIWVDLEAYELAARDARERRTLAAFTAATDLYGGELLPDDRYEEWVADRREALTQDHLALLWELAALQEEAGDDLGASETLRQLVSIDPAHEDAHRRLMRLYAMNGQHRLAVRQFEVVRTTLRRELDVDPDDATVQLYRAILAGEIDARSGADPPPTARRPAAAAPRSAPPHNLPVQLSSFIGRDREVADVDGLLAGARILTLTGVGGCGKTRLAIEVAAEVRGRFPAGVWFVPLAALGRPSLVIQAIAEVFEVREQRGTPLLDSVAAHIGERQLLLVLDNCEHLVDACAEITQSLVAACPELRVMTTSRQPIRIAGEVVFRVPSLELPDPQTDEAEPLASVASVQLFTDRARSIAPGFTLDDDNAADVAQLCLHLDGIPLAIELAASRVAAFPVATIVERLDDRFRFLVGGSRTAISRQQTLKATLDWSYQLLNEAEAAVLRRLAVFVGGVPLDAGTDVCAEPGAEPGAILPQLGELVDKSLVVPDEEGTEARFRLLETVREYGLERLDEVGELAEIEARHARWFLTIVERARAALPTPDRGQWLARLEREHDNIRAAFDRSLVSQPGVAMRLAACLWHFWLWRAYLTEGRRRIGLVLDRTDDPSADRAEAMLGAASLGVRAGDVRESVVDAMRAADLAGSLDEGTIVCRASQVAGVAFWSQDELDEARSAFERGLAVSVEFGFEPGRATSTHNLGVVEHIVDPARARRLVDESLAWFRRLADTPQLAPPMMDVGEFVVDEPGTDRLRMSWGETLSPFQDVPCVTGFGCALANQAMLARIDGDLAQARARMEEALELFERLGDHRAIGQALTRLGNLAISEMDLGRARELLEAGFELRRQIGDWRGMVMSQRGLGNLAAAEGDRARARRLFEEAAATFLRRGDRWGHTGALVDLANLAATGDDQDEARARLDESIGAITRAGRTRWLGWAKVQSAELHRRAGERALADTAIAEALTIFERLGDHVGIQRCRELGA